MLDYISTVVENYPQLICVKDELYIPKYEYNPLSFFKQGSRIWFKNENSYDVFALTTSFNEEEIKLENFVCAILDYYHSHYKSPTNDMGE